MDTYEMKQISSEEKPRPNYKWEYKWFNIIMLSLIHSGALYTIIVYPFIRNWKITLGFTLSFSLFAMGVTAGVHRLWAHRTYKAYLPLRIFLMLVFSANGHGTIYDWARDHRVHHKYSETDADPHNAKRGFFFAHVGWLLIKKYPSVIARGKAVDMSDILDDPVARFNMKYYYWIAPVFAFILPTIIFHYLSGESWFWSIMGQCFVRYCMFLNLGWSVNSAAHLYGMKPYDKTIGPVDSKLVSYFTGGEGWHNYHHSFPWDYKTAELPYYFNLTTLFLDFCGKMGWAYDFKTASSQLIKKMVDKSGDGSHFRWGQAVITENDYRQFEKENGPSI